MKRIRQVVAGFASIGGLLLAVVLIMPYNVVRAQTGTEGTVKFFVDADSSFDTWTSNPTAERQAWMRENYFRMQTYSSYFDSRLAWYPNAWEYKDAYAIKPGWTIYAEHPEWVLKDASGANLYVPWGCSGGTCPQFAADIGNPGFRSWWIEGFLSKITIGYLGAWIDDVNMIWRVSDGNGDTVEPIDPRTNKPMTLAAWRGYMADFMEEVRAAAPSSEIAHNIIWYAGPMTDPSILRLIDAADYINLERGISDGGINGGAGTFGFETYLALVDLVHARGKNVILDDSSGNSIPDRDYELAFYFLINNGGDLLGADGDRGRMNPDNFWSGYEIDLGAPLGPRYLWNGLFRRDFECGLVLVNQPDRPTVNVSVVETFFDLEGQAVTAVSLEAARGQVLQRAIAGIPGATPPTRPESSISPCSPLRWID